MGRKAKEFNKDGTFQTRFREQYTKNNMTQKEMAAALDVSRPTVAGWLDGKNIPDIISLAKMARHFKVSADYLLGLSDMASPDVTLRAAAEYTGLSEKAVERLHIGIDDFECEGISVSEEEKKQNLCAASVLIQSDSFTKMMQHLREVAQVAYLEKILTVLYEQYSENDDQEYDDEFHFAKKEDRDITAAEIIHVMETEELFFDEPISVKVKNMNDDELMGCVIEALHTGKEKNALHQFHAAKAFARYIDQVVEAGRKKAEQHIKKLCENMF